jgi:hypothetical protein
MKKSFYKIFSSKFFHWGLHKISKRVFFSYLQPLKLFKPYEFEDSAFQAGFACGDQ